MDQEEHRLFNRIATALENIADSLNTLIGRDLEAPSQSAGGLLRNTIKEATEQLVKGRAAVKYAIGDMMAPERGYMAGPYDSIGECVDIRPRALLGWQPNTSYYIFELPADKPIREWSERHQIWCDILHRYPQSDEGDR